MNRWILGARPRTLPAAVVPVALGAAASVGEHGAAWWRVPLAGAVALALQVGVNYANDYSDGVRGTDEVRVGPVRLVASGAASPGAVKRAAFIAFGVAAVAGLVLAVVTTWWLLAVGAACIAAGWFYTGGPRPYGYAGFGEVFVFVFFGLVAGAGTMFVVVERITALGLVVAAGAGCLACSLLVINNLRDIPTDRVVGKNTLAVRLGDARTRTLYTALIAGSIVAVGGAGLTRPCALAAIPVAVAAAIAPIRVVRSGATGPALIAALVATSRLQLAYGASLAVGLVLGA